jgi:hypothetical protein
VNVTPGLVERRKIGARGQLSVAEPQRIAEHDLLATVGLRRVAPACVYRRMRHGRARRGTAAETATICFYREARSLALSRLLVTLT